MRTLAENTEGYWKLRVVDYRVVFKIKGNEIVILPVPHGKEVYDIVSKDRK